MKGLVGLGVAGMALLVFAPSSHAQNTIDPLEAFRCEQAFEGANYGDAVRRCEPLAQQGLADAQLILGELYQKGLAVRSDPAEAARWYERAALQGQPQAQFNLGIMHRYGAGVPLDLVEAHAWLSLAADAGVEDAAVARDSAKRRMSRSQISTAEALAERRRSETRSAEAPRQADQPAPAMTRRQLTSAIQGRLAKLEYDPGPVDGLTGGKTRTAIRQFQSNVELPVTGEVSAALLERLDRADAEGHVASRARPEPEPVQRAVARAPKFEVNSDTQTQALVSEIKDEIDRGTVEGLASTTFLNQLRDAIRPFDWPWQRELINETFRDGDITANPPWTIASGTFGVRFPDGLVTNFVPQAPVQFRRESDRTSRVIGALLQEVLRDDREDTGTARQATEAEIYTSLVFSNAFVVTTRMSVRSGRRAADAVAVKVFSGSDRSSGYELSITPGTRPRVQLLRVSSRGSSVIDERSPSSSIYDGSSHDIQWRRWENGEMVVTVDGIELIRVVDRGLRGEFAGLSVLNRGGTYTFEKILLHALP